MPDDLLNEALSAAEDGSPANSAGRTPLVIDSDLRTIRVPKDYVFGVFNDKDVLSVPFVVPRFYDDVDLSTFDIRVNFTNKSGASSYYDVTESTVTSDTIEFYWLLGTAVFLRSGEVEFAVCLRKIEEDGLITKEFNTTLASATILPGLEIESPSDPAQYSILVQMRNLADEAQEAAEQAATFIGAPLKAETVSAMTDTNRIYVYVGDETDYTFGHWYYSDNGTWTDGGIYNAVASVVDATLTEEGMAADAKATGDAIQNGIYPDLYAGNLVSDRRKIDTTPYLFRPTANGASKVGDRKYLEVVGATVNVNQLVASVADSRDVYGITRTRVDDNTGLTYTGTSERTTNYTAIGLISGIESTHRYYAGLGNVSLPHGARINLSNTDKCSETIVTGSRISGSTFGVIINEGTTVDFTVYPQCIDLTTMFGSTIADHLYNLEQTTAGAGIAKLREWGFFTGEYIPYTPVDMQSVRALKHVTVGFNQWDEEWEVYGASGQIKSKNRIPVIEGATYYLNSRKGCTMYLFSDKTSANIGNITVSAHSTFSIPQGVHYILMYTDVNYGTTYNHDICINLSWSGWRNGEYEPYVRHEYTLDPDLTLRGVPKLDAQNNLYYDGDEYNADGVVSRRYGILVLNGTESWIKSTSYEGNYYVSMRGIVTAQAYAKNTTLNIVTTNGLKPVDTTQGLASNDLCTLIDGGVTPNINIKNASKATLEDFKAWLASSPITVVYELATPTTEQSTPFTSPQVCYPDGTEEFVTENGVPVGHKTEYLYDVKALAEGLIDVPDVPATNGTYTLKATRSASGITYSWVSG